MFAPSGPARKPLERREARRLRREDGLSIKRIAARLGVSPSSVHAWTRDIELTPEQRDRNLGKGIPADAEVVNTRARGWSERNRQRRHRYQLEGRQRARDRDPLHMAGCMLYWAEGAKSRNTVHLANSDVHLVRFFRRFLTARFSVRPQDFRVRLNVYLNNGLSIEEIEHYWLNALELPRSTLRRHALDFKPKSSSGRKRGKLPYGVCTLSVNRSTWIVQHIYGAIQEYAGFEQSCWLDGPRVRAKSLTSAAQRAR